MLKIFYKGFNLIIKNITLIVFIFIGIIILQSCNTTGNLIKNTEFSDINLDILEDRVSLDLNGSIKIIQVSDLHFEREKNIYNKVVNIINSVNPDLLFIAGDSIEYKKNYILLEKFLKKINPSIIKFSILGNHEYGGNIDIDELEKFYTKYNCKLLKNNGEKIVLNNNKINIFGTDDYCEFKDDLSGFQPDKNSLNIILTHCPIVFEKINTKFPDCNIFVFSGHTHGGEITLFSKPIVLPRGSGNYVKGKFVNGSNTLYVSKGIGSGGILDIRIFAKRDIIIIDFKK